MWIIIKEEALSLQHTASYSTVQHAPVQVLYSAIQYVFDRMYQHVMFLLFIYIRLLQYIKIYKDIIIYCIMSIRTFLIEIMYQSKGCKW